ncbi:MAG: hypothetical protein ICV83_04085 [Cytophagales bacterium]|nr:hypothetical protein [Cytophagales bacterium]
MFFSLMDFSSVNVKKSNNSPTLTSGPGELNGTTMQVKGANTLTIGQSYYLECTGPRKMYEGMFTGTSPVDGAWLVFQPVS